MFVFYNIYTIFVNNIDITYNNIQSFNMNFSVVISNSNILNISLN